MARHTQVLYTDDLDGSQAASTVRFSFASTEFEIDLSTENAARLAKALEPFISSARKVSRTAAPKAGGPGRRRNDQRAVRAWAREQGLPVSDIGRIPADAISRYDAAH